MKRTATAEPQNRSLVLVNDQLVSLGEAVVSVTDRGFLSADGLYETLRTYEGRVFALADHIARLAAGCQALEIPARMDVALWRRRIERVLETNGFGEGNSRLRIVVTRGPDHPRAGLADSGCTTFVAVERINQAPIDERRARGTGAVVIVAPRVAGARRYQIKTLSLIDSHLAAIACRRAGVNDAIFQNTRGEICEALTSNVFLLFGDRLVTPPVEAPCLPGVTRHYLLQTAPEDGWRPDVRPVAVGELFEADEVVTCASVAEIHSIISVDGRTVGGGKPGPGARRLQAFWRQRAAQLSGK